VNGTALSHGLEVICGLGKYASRFLRAVNTPATVHHHGTFGVVARRRQRANRADGAYYARRCHVRRAGCAVYGLAVRVLRRRQGQLQAMMRDVVTEGTTAGIGFGPSESRGTQNSPYSANPLRYFRSELNAFDAGAECRCPGRTGWHGERASPALCCAPGTSPALSRSQAIHAAQGSPTSPPIGADRRRSVRRSQSARCEAPRPRWARSYTSARLIPRKRREAGTLPTS
jgi:hypothetical protein